MAHYFGLYFSGLKSKLQSWGIFIVQNKLINYRVLLLVMDLGFPLNSAKNPKNSYLFNAKDLKFVCKFPVEIFDNVLWISFQHISCKKFKLVICNRKSKTQGKKSDLFATPTWPNPKKWHQNPNPDMNFGCTKTQKPRKPTRSIPIAYTQVLYTWYLIFGPLFWGILNNF